LSLMRAQPTISIAICTHNRAALLERTLGSLRELHIPSGVVVELVVVASACTDATLDVLRKARHELPFSLQIVDERTPGLSLARNRGLRATRSDLIAFLDDDVWVERGWLDALVEAANRLPAQLFAGRVTLDWQSGRPQWASSAVESLLSANDRGSEEREVGLASALVGANFALRRSVVESVGDFQESLGRRGLDLLSGEESELVKRALTNDLRLYYVPGMAVRHWVSHERATKAHLESLAFARGRTRVALLGERRWKKVFACVRLGAAQTVLGGVRELSAWWRRDAAQKVSACLLRQRGLGTLSALLRTARA